MNFFFPYENLKFEFVGRFLDGSCCVVLEGVDKLVKKI